MKYLILLILAGCNVEPAEPNKPATLVITCRVERDKDCLSNDKLCSKKISEDNFEFSGLKLKSVTYECGL